jgi:hypothetical protein
MKTSQQGFLNIMMLVWVVVIIGWILNIVQVVQQMPATLNDATPMFLIKAVCILVAPAGAVFGYIGLF